MFKKLTDYVQTLLTAFFVYLVISCLFFWRVILNAEVLFFGDTLLQRVPSMVFWKEQVLQLKLPLWNPYIFAGVPHLADLSTNTLSPFNLIYLIVGNPFYALSLLVILSVSLAGLGTFVFLRIYGCSYLASYFGGIVFAFSGTVLAASNDINSLQGIIFMPWILAAGQVYVQSLESEKKHKKWHKVGLLVTFVLLLQFVSGHPQYSYYSWLMLGTYLLVFIRKSLLEKALYFAYPFGLFLGISAIQLLPFLELSTLTFRPKQIEFSTANSLEILDVPQLLLGHFYGTWANGDSWGPGAPLETGRANSEGFVGVFVILFALISLKSKKRKRTAYFLGVLIASFLLSLGSTTPLYSLVRTTLPLFEKFRSPIRILSVYSLSVAILASYGIEYVQHKYIRSPGD